MPTAKKIFALRREHRHAEAIAAARELYARSPDDPWSIRSLGWCLHDELSSCKQCHYSGVTDPMKRQHLIAEFAALAIPPDDELLLQMRAQHADPLAEVLQAARRDQDDGRIEQARARLAQACRENPNHPQLNERLAWVLWRLALDELKKEKPEPQVISRMLGEYARLHIEKPSDIHSRILGVAARAGAQGLFNSFCRFLQWWDTRNLHEQDWQRQIGSEKQFDSLAEQVIRAIAKTFEDEQDHDAAQYAVDFLLSHADKYPNQEWFPYYSGEALLWLGRTEEARKRLLPVLRAKSSEFWAWHVLARTFSPGDPHRLPCLCKAIACPVKGPEFLLNVRVDLAEELVSSGYPDLARHEIECVVKLRQERGWPIRGRLRGLLDAAWFAKASPHEDKGAYAKWADDAQEALTEDIPWLKAVLAVPRVLLGKEQRPGSIVDVADDMSCILSIPVRKTAFPELDMLPAGTPLDTRVAISGEHPRIVAIRRRTGEPWDILSPIDAIVEHVNVGKGVTMLMLADGRMARAYHSDVENAAQIAPGSFMSCRVVDDRDTAKVRWMTTATHPPESSHWRMYSGEFRRREKGGGHAANVFIPTHTTNDFIDGCTVTGIAVKRTDRDTHHSWWEALTAEMT